MTRPHLGNLRDLHLRKIRRLTAGQLHHRTPTFSPDGRFILHALSSGIDSQWLCTDRKGRVARVLLGPVEGRAAIARDHSIAYSRQVGATCEIWLLTAGNSEPRRLFGGDGRLYRDPTFSPDGRRVAYLADDGGNSIGQLRLWCYDLTRGSHELLLGALPGHSQARLQHPVWAPWGDSLFFEAHIDGGTAIFELALAGGPLSQRSPVGYSSPAPLARGLLVAAHHADPQSGELVLLAYPPCADRLRQAVLLDRKHCAGEPTVAWDKKNQVFVAFTMPGTTHSGEPQRCDLHLGLLSKLPRGARLSSDGGQDAPSSDDKPGRESSTASAHAMSTVLDDRPMPAMYGLLGEQERSA